MSDLTIVDLSHWNEVESFAAAKAAGLIGIIHKATEGRSYLDPTYHQREQAARAAGLGWGAYHFLKHGNAAEQMAWFLGQIEAPPGMRIAIDYEDAGCSLSDLHEAVRYLERYAPGLELAIYGGSLLKEHLGDSADPLLASHSLWLAQYTTATPTWPVATWKTVSLWQYSDGHSGGQPRAVPGLVQPFDCNAFNGTRENCAKWIGLEGAPAPEPAATVIEVALRIEIDASGHATAEVIALATGG